MHHLRRRALLLASFALACATTVRPAIAQPMVATAERGVAAVASTFTQDVLPRTLDWPRLSVRAHLDSAGVLHVTETQVLRFTGDWNGGERIFRVGADQELRFVGLTRVDSASGLEVPLREGPLDAVDEFAWTSATTLRWRSRLPTDPPFVETRRTYVLTYALGGVLRARDGLYALDHEFGFRDRQGNIDTLEVALSLDPVWRARTALDSAWVVTDLPPGESFVVTASLAYAGDGAPSAVVQGASTTRRTAIALCALLGAGVLLLQFLREERALGRFGDAESDEPIDRAWITRHVLAMPPEVAGAAWDMQVGPPEVSAVLARLVDAGALHSEVRTEGWKWFTRSILTLELRVPRDTLRGYDRALVDAFFFAGRTRVDTDEVRTHYQRTGFSPAGTIRSGVLAALQRVPDAGLLRTPPSRTWWVVGGLLLGLGLLMTGMARSGSNAAIGAVTLGLTLFTWMFTGVQAGLWQSRVRRAAVHFLRVLLPLLALATALVLLARTTRWPVSVWTQAGASALVLTVWLGALSVARSRMSAERLRFRRRQARARSWFQRELQQARPALDDAWYPWLLAFGLNRHVTRWFRAHGPASRSASVGHVGRSTTGPSASGESTGGGWSGFGGGGGFAGAGATVAFGAAVSGLAGGVSAPSSSGSGGGSRSSSGGSSGGGGGGGW